MSDRERNWEAANHQANTCHEEVYRLMIDLAVDDGNEDLAGAYRWLLAENKWPIRNTKGQWYWSYTKRISKTQYTWTLPVKPPQGVEEKDLKKTCAEALHLAAKLLKQAGIGKWE
jgi:hypothetical protein